ncbi:MAG: carbohydrate porin [Candidatus Gastranaerophilaceae bacterium]|jgi:porin
MCKNDAQRILLEIAGKLKIFLMPLLSSLHKPTLSPRLCLCFTFPKSDTEKVSFLYEMEFSRILLALLFVNIICVNPVFSQEQLVNTQSVNPITTQIQQQNQQEALIVNNAKVENQAIESPAVDKTLKIEKKHGRFGFFRPIYWLKGGVEKAKKPEQEKTAEQPSLLKGWIEGNYATNDWGGLRTKLEDHGVVINSFYQSDMFGKLSGGLSDNRTTKTFGYVETNLAVDTKKLGLWSGGKFDIRYGNKHGIGVSRDTLGEYMGINSYDSKEFNQIEEYYYEQSLFSDRLKVKVGKQDASYDICALASGLNFVGNSFCYVANMPLPWYPNPAMGALVTVKPLGWLSLKSGAYDGNARGTTSGFDTTFGANKSTFFVEELGIKHNKNNHPGNYMAGYWLLTKHTDKLTSGDPFTYGQNTGMYMCGEQMLYKENKDKPSDDQGLTALSLFGWAPSDRNVLTQYYGAGIQYKGLISKRETDIAGIGTSIGRFSPRLNDIDGRHGYETILEMFYRFQLTKWLAIVPDLQYVFHPNGKGRSSFLMGIRFNVVL